MPTCSKCTCNIKPKSSSDVPDVQLPPIKINHVRLMPFTQTIDWGYQYLQASKFKNQTLEGENAIVFILDTGIARHEDLDANRLFEYDRNFTDDTEITHPHGTHCAGIVAAVNNEVGILGVAPKAKLVDIQVLTGRGGGSYKGIADGIDYVTNLELAEPHKGMKKIISMSLGGPNDNEFMHKAVLNAVENGVFIIAAAGNSGYKEGENTIGYPGRYPEVITVASLDNDGNDNAGDQTAAGYSSAGPEVDVAAPGSNVLSTVLNNGYAKFSGTSMACPQVAGMCALLLTAKPDVSTQSELENLLKQHALDLMDQGFDVKTGFGAPLVTNYLAEPEQPEDPEDPEDPDTPPTEPPFHSSRVNQSVVIRNVIHWKNKGDKEYNPVEARIVVSWMTRESFHKASDMLKLATDKFFSKTRYTFNGNGDLYMVHRHLRRRLPRYLKSLYGATEVIRIRHITLTDESGRIYEWC